MIELGFERAMLSWLVLATLHFALSTTPECLGRGGTASSALRADDPLPSTGSGLRREFTPSGILVRSSGTEGPGWTWSLALASLGRGSEQLCASEPALERHDGRIEYRRPGLVEWYVEDGSGIEHGFTLVTPPAVADPGSLRLELAISGSLAPSVSRDGRTVRFETAEGRTALVYDGLQAWDAELRPVPARLGVEGDLLVIEIQDEGARWPIVVDPVIYTEDAKIVPENPTLQQYFGISAAGDGSSFVIGDDFASGSVVGSGGAFVYVRAGGSWIRQASLFADDGAASDWFGSSVSMSGDTVVAGAPEDDDDHGWSTGSAYVFVRNGTTWTQVQKLTALDAAASDRFGASVSVEGDSVLIGAPEDDDMGPNSGSAYVFCREGSSWVQKAKLTAPDGASSEQFGHTVLLHGTNAFCTAFLDDFGSVRSGSVYVFQGGCGAWNFQAKLVPSDGVDGAQFGHSLAALDGRLAVGSPGAIGAVFGTGAVYLYQGSGASWALQQKIFAPDGQYEDLFGFSIALEEPFLAISSEGGSPAPSSPRAVRIYRPVGSSWVDDARLFPSGGTGAIGFGRSVASMGNTVVVGANRGGPLTTGTAYVFELGDPIEASCFGDGSGSPCPCFNESAPGTGSGCNNSTGAGGRLVAMGTNRLGASDLVLTAEQLVPNRPALLFAGQNRVNDGAGVSFGDGLRCAGGGILRLSVQSADSAGAASWGPGLPPSTWRPGERAHFQVWYRDPIGSPCGAGFNSTNGLMVRWVK